MDQAAGASRAMRHAQAPWVNPTGPDVFSTGPGLFPLPLPAAGVYTHLPFESRTLRVT
jgi:hypothetical protein